MFRQLLTVVLPFLLPFLLYAIYVLIQRARARREGAGEAPGWTGAPWAKIIIAGVILAAATLITVRFTIEEQPRDYPRPRIEGDSHSSPAGSGTQDYDRALESDTQQ